MLLLIINFTICMKWDILGRNSLLSILYYQAEYPNSWLTVRRSVHVVCLARDKVYTFLRLASAMQFSAMIFWRPPERSAVIIILILDTASFHYEVLCYDILTPSWV